MPSALTPHTRELSYIFYKIRACRAGQQNLRRSWMRRARLALRRIWWMTDKTRHEVMCVWSRDNVGQIASHALARLHGRRVNPHFETIPARRYYRAGFTPSGASKRRVMVVNREAANDGLYLMWA